jgi:hypothetical protein
VQDRQWDKRAEKPIIGFQMGSSIRREGTADRRTQGSGGDLIGATNVTAGSPAPSREAAALV